MSPLSCEPEGKENIDTSSLVKTKKKENVDYSPYPTNAKIQLSSYEVFMTFVERDGDEVNVEKVFSTECYSLWLKTRTKELKRPEESFQRTLTSHVKGTDQRKPFPEDVEAGLLKKLRRKQSWDCFEKLGRYGFRGQGYHEKKQIEKTNLSFEKKRKFVDVPSPHRPLRRPEFLHRAPLPQDYRKFHYPTSRPLHMYAPMYELYHDGHFFGHDPFRGPVKDVSFEPYSHFPYPRDSYWLSK